MDLQIKEFIFPNWDYELYCCYKKETDEFIKTFLFNYFLNSFTEDKWI